jgi:hypothetical protein
MAVNIAGFGLLEIEKLTPQKRASKRVRFGYNGSKYWRIWDFGNWHCKKEHQKVLDLAIMASGIKWRILDFGIWNLMMFFFKIFLALQTIFAVQALSLTLQKRASKSVRTGYNGIWYKVKDLGLFEIWKVKGRRMAKVGLIEKWKTFYLKSSGSLWVTAR